MTPARTLAKEFEREALFSCYRTLADIPVGTVMMHLGENRWNENWKKKNLFLFLMSGSRKTPEKAR